MNQFRDLIEGKSVAVVGRGTYLGGIEQGELIDSYDVVARIHSPLPHPHHQYDNWHLDPDGDSFVPKDWQSRIGAKTQLFAPDLVPRGQDTIRRIFSYLRRVGCLMAIMHKCYNVNSCVAKIDLIQDNFMPVHLASVQHFVDLCRDMAYAFPLPGSLLIYEILKYRPKTLYHTGFACFQDEPKQSERAHVVLTRPHNVYADLRYLRKITTHNERITTDDYMLDLFEREKNLE